MSKTVTSFLISIVVTGLFSCTPQEKNKLNGTWRLVSSEQISGGESKKTFPIKGQEMIKMFNDTHFSFFKHDIYKGKTNEAVFDAGSGSYSLEGSVYKEHLAYCSYRDWENRDFSFDLIINQDTLIQRGIEKIDSLNINHEIVEIYVRVNQ